MAAAAGPRDARVESALAGRVTGGASDGREQVSWARHASQVGGAAQAESGEAECGAQHLDGQTSTLKHYRF